MQEFWPTSWLGNALTPHLDILSSPEVFEEWEPKTHVSFFLPNPSLLHGICWTYWIGGFIVFIRFENVLTMISSNILFHFLNSILFFGGCSYPYISCSKLSHSSLILSSLSSIPLLCFILGSFYCDVSKFADLFFFRVSSAPNPRVFFISDTVFLIFKSLTWVVLFFFKKYRLCLCLTYF